MALATERGVPHSAQKRKPDCGDATLDDETFFFGWEGPACDDSTGVFIVCKSVDTDGKNAVPTYLEHSAHYLSEDHRQPNLEATEHLYSE